MRRVVPSGTRRSIFAVGFTMASVPASFSFLANAGTHMEGGASGAGCSRQPPCCCSCAAVRDSPELVWAETMVASEGKRKMEYTIRQDQGIYVSLKHLRGEKMQLQYRLY